jgi:hypothetical protein
MKILSSLNNVSKVPLLLIGLVLIGLIGAVDYVTGPELSFSVFYLIPVAVVTWYVGKQSGVLAAALSALTCWWPIC